MEHLTNLDQLLDDIASKNDKLIIDKPAIQAQLLADAAAYKGLGIKLLSICGGLLASLFFIGFIELAMQGSSTASLILGFAIIAGTIYIDKVANNTLLDAASIGAYLMGCLLIGYGTQTLSTSENITALAMLFIGIITMAFTASFMLNFFSVLLINGSLFSLIKINNTYSLMHILCGLIAIAYVAFSLSEAKILSLGRGANARFMPVLNGLLFSFVALLFYTAVAGRWYDHFANQWISSVIFIAIVFYLLNTIIQNLKITQTNNIVFIYLVSLAILAPAVFAPSICGALLIALLSFSRGHRTGIITGIMSLIYFVGQYYYDLQYTLLIKSGIMFGTGVLFLLAWFILKKQLQRYEQN